MEIKLVQQLDEESLWRVAEIHKLNYPHDHLTSNFTLPLLAEYYRNIAELSDYIVVAYFENKIVGFAFLGRSFASVLSRLILNNKYMSLSFFLQKPLVTSGFIFSKVFSKTYNLDSDSNIRLISITTDKEFSKLRIGTSIVNKLTELQSEYQLNIGLSVKASNFKAVNFYIKNGYIVEGYSKGKLFMVKTNA
ncbi:GNAT family N-acetyltransferase [Pseudoalteromonas rubra]|uniref:GNAT family N-acetyltransferase n=1 Tax=Pseudoalteromonas rubra TaxID=43658 RepID=UPI0013DE4350|nr:GNAT family N-acetyltransferase [Pseudoalteromonas rubra]